MTTQSCPGPSGKKGGKCEGLPSSSTPQAKSSQPRPCQPTPMVAGWGGCVSGGLPPEAFPQLELAFKEQPNSKSGRMSHHLILVRTGTPRAAILESTQGLQEQGQSIFQLVGSFCKIPLTGNFFSLYYYFLSIHYFTLYKFIFPPLSIEITLMGDYPLIPESPIRFFFLSLSQQKYILKKKKSSSICFAKLNFMW